jgi:hypothetical protein
MSVAPSRSLQASALSFLFLSIGHTVCSHEVLDDQITRELELTHYLLQIGGKQWTAEKAFKAIANSKPWACGTVGWYQVRVC